MARRYYLRNTNLATGLHAVTHEKEMDLTVQSGGGTGLVSDALAEGTNALLYIFTTPSGEPGQATWPASSGGAPYHWSLDISAAGANMNYGHSPFSHLARADSTLSSETVAADLSLGSFTGTGIKTGFDSAGTPPTGAASDRVCLAVVGQNQNTMHSSETITLDVDSADSWFEGPWDAPVVVPVPRHPAVNFQDPGIL